MNILIVTPYFHPENFRINDFALEFKNKGHNVSVLTPIPNYPDGKYYKGYGLFKKTREYFEGIIIYRSPLIPRGSGTNWMLGISWLSSIFGNLLTSIFLLKNTFDLIFVFGPSPFTVCLPALFIKKFNKIPIFFWVLDLWPESVSSAGNLKTKFIPNILMPMIKLVYKNCDKILVSSPGFIKSIASKGINKRKIHFFPQWAESVFRPITTTEKKLPIVPKDSFVIIFAGNIGEAQDFKSILKAAAKLRENRMIHWVILGSGRKEQWVTKEIQILGMNDTFHMMGRYPYNDMPEFFSLADVMLISLKNEYIFSLTVPAKLQSYMACGKPILAMMNGEGAKIVDEAGAGLTCAAENPEALAKNVLEMYNAGQARLARMGKNAVSYYKRNFDRSLLLDRFEKLFESAITQA